MIVFKYSFLQLVINSVIISWKVTRYDFLSLFGLQERFVSFNSQ